jgi:hypothetical protein
MVEFMISKTKIISGFIFIVIGQLIAFIIWKFFNQNYFIPLIIASTLGFFVSYKGKKNRQR